MPQVSDHIYQLIKSKTYADPFHLDFNLDQLYKEFGENANDEELSILFHLKICNQYWRGYQEQVFGIFNELKFSKEDLREFLFIGINKSCLLLSHTIYQHGKEMTNGVIDLERIKFSEFENLNGEIVQSQFAIEVGGDILSELIYQVHLWSPNVDDFKPFDNSMLDQYNDVFHYLFGCTNIIYNVKETFDTIRYEFGTVELRENGNEIKIQSGIGSISILKNVADLRKNSNHNELIVGFNKYYKRIYKNKKGLEVMSSDNNALKLKTGGFDIMNKVKSDSILFLFHPHFEGVKLDFFGGVSLNELLDIAVLIEDGIDSFFEENNERIIAEVPIKFTRVELSKFLADLSGHSIEIVNKLLESLTTDSDQPYFWRKPFIQHEDNLYFSLNAIRSPNYSLYIDGWLSSSGFNHVIQERFLKEYLVKELLEDKLEFQFKFVDLEKIDDFKNQLTNNILIETESKYLFLEIKLFDFPIEPNEINQSFFSLANTVVSLEEKFPKLESALDNDKECIKLVITSYMHFSGLQINSIPIIDFRLFKHYVVTGKFTKGTVHIGKDGLDHTEVASIVYYKNEQEFNSNLKSFFDSPLPIDNITNKLFFKEIQVTPNDFIPALKIDIVDYLGEAELMDSKIENLRDLLNYEYFIEPEDQSTKESLEQSINFFLAEIIGKLAFAPYEGYIDRIKIYNSTSKVKLNGFIHLSYFLYSTLGKLNKKEIVKSSSFEPIDFHFEEMKSILSKVGIVLSGNIRLGDFEFERGLFTSEEERKLISYSISTLSILKPLHVTDQEIDILFQPLLILKGFASSHELTEEFYKGCSIVIDLLNHNHRYQLARDFCEEILQFSIRERHYSFGWNILFKCYSTQRSSFDGAIYGCLFFASLVALPSIPYYLIVEALYESLKFFRNFRLIPFAKNVYESSRFLQLEEYDEQKITLGYFNTFFLLQQKEEEQKLLIEISKYLEKNSERIISFSIRGVSPWLAMLYNMVKIDDSLELDFSDYIKKFEESIDVEDLQSIKLKIFGDSSDPKSVLISTLLSTFETRYIEDFINETNQLSAIANQVVQSSIMIDDMGGILLTGLILNDQSFSFQNIYVEKGSTSPVTKSINEELKLRLESYKEYVISSIEIKPKQLLIWLFEVEGKVYTLFINSDKNISCKCLSNWDSEEMDSFLDGLPNFYFNAKKNSEGNPRSKFSNPRGDSDYNDLIQIEDYNNLRNALSFTDLELLNDLDEIFLCTSIKMSSFPHNLIQIGGDFIASQLPTSNVISIEYFLKNQKITIPSDYSVSAWIPIKDKEPTISWGYEKLEPLLNRIGATIYTSTYPEKMIESDINVFLAHGVTDNFGFKAIYTNHEEMTAIEFPLTLFGQGKIAILFICNSGSSKEAMFSNNIVSFSGELLKSGYEAVVAPFWPFDVTMSKIWFEEFLLSFNEGFSISYAVWLANYKLSKYDEESSTMYIAPTGCLSMHLYGNPNICIDK